MSDPEKLTTSSTNGSNGFTYFLRIALIVAFVGALVLQVVAGYHRQKDMEQLALIAEVGLIVITLIAFAMRPTPQITKTQEHALDDPASKLAEQKRKNDEWLRRLAIALALGMCVIVLYAAQWVDDGALLIIGLGLLTAGAFWLLAVVVGFLFGIPHRNQPSTGVYRPSTSLEEVADWLTKMIVGVGLTQVYKLPGKLDSLAAYIAAGMGNPSHKVFALSICLYFTPSGFLFGFLWARLFIGEAFQVADPAVLALAAIKEVKAIGDRIESAVSPGKASTIKQ